MKANILFTHIFNVFDLLLLTTFALAVVLAIPLLVKRDRQISDVLLALFVLSQGFYAFYSVMLFNSLIGDITREALFPFYKIPHLLVLGAQGLLMLWYTRTMMGRSSGFRSNVTVMVICLVSVTIAINLYFNVTSQGNTNVLMACAWFLNVCSVFLGIAAVRQLHMYELHLPFIHSTIEKHSLKWLRIITLGFVLVWVLPVIADFSAVFISSSFAEIFYLARHIPPLILISSMVIYSQTHAMSRPLESNDSEIKTPEKPQTAVNTKTIEQLNDLMERVKVYQDPDLRLDDLADSMGISPRTLSNILNKHFQKNFYDFVNQYRIRDVKVQLAETRETPKTIQRVFEDAGFNSKTTFNTLFKKSTGLTPSEFRNSIQGDLPHNQLN